MQPFWYRRTQSYTWYKLLCAHDFRIFSHCTFSCAHFCMILIPHPLPSPLIQFYLRMSLLQTSHRRIILVHCDQITSKRVIDTARNLDLFSGRKIWVLLDGVIGSEITSQSLWRHLKVDLPDGMLALHKRSPTLTDARSLFAIIKVIGDAAANTHANAKSWLSNDDQTQSSSFYGGASSDVSCWKNTTASRVKYSQILYRYGNNLCEIL